MSSRRFIFAILLFAIPITTGCNSRNPSKITLDNVEFYKQGGVVIKINSILTGINGSTVTITFGDTSVYTQPGGDTVTGYRISVWVDSNGNGVVDPGEIISQEEEGTLTDPPPGSGGTGPPPPGMPGSITVTPGVTSGTGTTGGGGVTITVVVEVEGHDSEGEHFKRYFEDKLKVR